MYNPSRFQGSVAQIEEIVAGFPFATVLTADSSGLKISHVPLVLEKRGGDWILIGHLARANEHWGALEGAECTAIFHGPHAYITPLWYEQCDVPTWNYVTAHLSGKVRLLESEADTVKSLQALSAKTE